MRFWDSSALVSLVAGQSAAEQLKEMVEGDGGLALWWATRVESIAAIWGLCRRGAFDEANAQRAVEEVEAFVSDADEVAPADGIREMARRLLRVHSLRAADALQLAAALVWAGPDPSGVGFVCLDRRLGGAAAREGFAVVPR